MVPWMNLPNLTDFNYSLTGLSHSCWILTNYAYRKMSYFFLLELNFKMLLGTHFICLETSLGNKSLNYVQKKCNMHHYNKNYIFFVLKSEITLNCNLKKIRTCITELSKILFFGFSAQRCKCEWSDGILSSNFVTIPAAPKIMLRQHFDTPTDPKFVWRLLLVTSERIGVVFPQMTNQSCKKHHLKV